MARTYLLSPGFVNSMMARAQSPGRVSTGVTVISQMRVALWSWRKSKVHQVRYGGLTFAAAR